MSIRRTSAATTINRGVTAAAATPVNIITGSGGTGATVNISSIQIANSGFTAIDDTAVSTAGGFLIINGTGFQSGATVRVQGTSANSVAFVSSSRLNVTVPAISSGTLDIYVINPDGSGAILLSGFVSSGTPTWTTTSPLTSQDADTAFSIQLAATGDGTVTYAVSSGSTLPPGTVLASNGVFSGTVTGLTEETTYTFSVDAIDNENQETARSFNITITAGDIYYNLTTLHLNGEVSGNSWITDASTNKFPLTVNGDVRPVAFSPYETVWSNFFDGTGDYLQTAVDSLFDLSTSDFTVECWVNPSATGFRGIWGVGPGGSSGIGLQLSNISSITVVVGNGSSAGFAAGSTQLSLNTWNHLALSRVGSTCRLYINGVLETTVTQASFGSGSYSCYVGDGWGISGGNLALNSGSSFNGYISNFRLVKGTALYTANFTPPTSALTAISNTTLLTCQSNRLIDNSTNNFTLTKNGDVTVSNFGPFTETDLVTGSAYFDGTGDYLTLADNAAWVFSGNFCIECWIYANSTSGDPFIVSQTDNSTAPGSAWILYITGNKLTAIPYGAGSAISDPTDFPVGRWTHVAYCRTSTTSSLYVNGNRVATASMTGSLNDVGATVAIAARTSGSNALNGNISNLRIINGNNPYDATQTTLTIPTSPLTAVANTSLLTLQNRFGENNNRFVDNSGINNLITRNGNATQGTASPYSLTGWSGFFNGSSVSTVASNAAFNLSSGTWTVEGWFYLTSAPAKPCRVLMIGTNNNLNSYVALNIQSNLTFGAGVPFSGTSVNSGTTAIPLNRWNHIAIVMNNSTGSAYLNGTRVGNQVGCTQMNNTSNSLAIGQDSTEVSVNAIYAGYISNLRIVKGTAVYSGTSYTVPTSPLTAISGTSFLTYQNNQFIDNGSSLTITSGGVSVQTFSPFKPTDSWSATTVGGSVYIDGTGDYLNWTNSNFSFGTGDFTIEAWIYVAAATDFGVFGVGGASAGSYGLYWINSSQKFQSIRYGDTAGLGTTTNTYARSQWLHVAAVRISGSAKVYVNGILDSGATYSMGSITNAGPYIGATWGSASGTGYISDLKVYRYGVYTTNFTPPTGPSNTPGNIFNMSGTNGSIIDYTSRNNLETVGNVQLRNNIVKYGNNSLFFDGTGDHMVVPAAENFVFPGDFTVEFWMYPTAVASGERGIVGIGTVAASRLVVRLQGGSPEKMSFWLNGPANNTVCSTSITVNQWYHVALVRSGSGSNNLKLYLNGVLDGQATSTYSVPKESTYIGRTYSNLDGEYFTGYIDDLRITKGYARYTANFTPPTSAFKIK